MEVKEHDPVTGRETTGHEWNGIKELDTPVPRGVLIFLIVTHIWAIAWWFLVPAWPLGHDLHERVFGRRPAQNALSKASSKDRPSVRPGQSAS